MEIQMMDCASCGAPIQIPDTTNLVTCPFCHTQLSINRDAGNATLKIAEQVGDAVQQSGIATQSAIRDGTQVTQSELRRLEISQDLALLQLQLTNIQSEIRSLEREKKDRVIKHQNDELRIQERDLQKRIEALQTALMPTKPVLQKVEMPTESRGTHERRPVSGWVFITIGGSIFLFGSCIFLVFIMAQFDNKTGVTDNLTGFLGAQTLCSLPLILIGLVLSLIGYLRLRNAKKVEKG